MGQNHTYLTKSSNPDFCEDLAGEEICKEASKEKADAISDM
jgi:hypothetical protein